jgi:hypothetical protein
LIGAASLYEVLRFDVINGHCGQGWALLVRRGMRSWCDKCRAAEQQPRQSKKEEANKIIFTTSLEQGLVEVLAGMVISLQPEDMCYARF